MSRIIAKKICLMGLTFFLSFSFAMAQRTVKGTVKDAADGTTSPGVNVVVRGTTIGTVTDMDGNFKLNVPASGNEIVVSAVGYVTQIIKLGTQDTYNISLSSSLQALEEVVVTGYGGTQKRAKLTNSISTVKEETLRNGVYSNPAQALSGAVSGLKVTQTSGRPGTVPSLVIRGGTNLDGSGSPLVIVDGQVRTISDINPEDIESMEVLKDAGATALYGARANNGVLLISTKRGKNGVSEISVKVKTALNYMNEPYKFLGAEDYLYWQRNAIYNSGREWQNSAGVWAGHSAASLQNTLSGATPYGVGNSYWDANGVPLDGNKTTLAIWSPMLLNETNKVLLGKGYKTMKDPITGSDIIYSEFDRSSTAFNNPALSQDYNLSMTGGNDRGNYYAGLGIHHDNGLPVKTWYQRLSFIFNGDYKINNWLTSYSSFNFNDARWYDVTTNSEGNYFARMLSAPPTMRQFNDAGELLLGNNLGDGNPLYNIDKFKRNNQTDKFTLGQSFKVNFTKDLYLKLNATWMFDEATYEAFNKDYLSSPSTYSTTRASSASFDRTLRQTYNSVLNYSHTFANAHTINGLVGTEFYDVYNKGLSASGSGAPTDDFMDLQYTSTKEAMRSIDSWHSRSRILSFFSRVNYDYKDKYILAVTARQDGYSVLIDNRWGFFPGVSAGWVVSKEKFMYNYKDLISFLKLRASYGLNGNVSGIGAYDLQGSYGTSLYGGQFGYSLGSLPIPSLRWERSNTKEGGFDIGLLQNKINLNFTYYNRLTLDKYASIPLPISSGYSSITSNNGEFRNKGVEIDLNVKALRKKDFTWDVNFNASYNKNTIERLPNNGLERNRQNAYQVYDPGTKQLIWVGGYQKGQTPGGIWAFEALGVFKDAAEVAKVAGDRIDITSGNNGSNGKKLVGPNVFNAMTDAQKATVLPIQPGDVNWKDVNGDGVINNFDMVYVGQNTPKWFGGINTNFGWKGITFSARVDYGLGFKQIDSILPWFLGNMQGTYNTVTEVKDTWTADNPNGRYPIYIWADQLGKRNYARNTSMFIYDASYLSFREISLSYVLPKNLVKKSGAKSCEVSVTGQNLGYWTKSKLYTPEIGGSVGGGYALPVTVIFGLNLKF